MTRHPFRWDAFIFGLFFLAVLTQWAVWEQDWLDQDDLAYLAAAALILLGVVGILVTVVGNRRPNEAPFAPEADATPETDAEPELETTDTTEGTR